MTDSTQPALHPERIRVALKSLRELARIPDQEANIVYDTAIAALELVRKGQLAVGLTGGMADAGQAALKLLATIQRLGK